MARVYLETSFFSACVWDRTDPKSLARQDDSRRWWVQQRGHHELCLCAEVLRELAEPSFRNRDDALALTAGIRELEITGDVLGFAKILVRDRVMPSPAEEGDAVHVAAATVHGVEYMLSWNVKHLANLRKVTHLREVCRRAGYVPPTIVTPDLLWM
jgi:predicted nucleic acid-binding protein